MLTRMRIFTTSQVGRSSIQARRQSAEIALERPRRHKAEIEGKNRLCLPSLIFGAVWCGYRRETRVSAHDGLVLDFFRGRLALGSHFWNSPWERRGRRAKTAGNNTERATTHCVFSSRSFSCGRFAAELCPISQGFGPVCRGCDPISQV